MSDLNNRRELWYQTDVVRPDELAAWYGGSSEAAAKGSADAGCSTHIPPHGAADFSEKENRKRRRTKIISLSVCAFVLAASVLTAVSSAVSLHRLRAQVSADAPGAAIGPYEYQEDYRDYFAERYHVSDDAGMERAEAAEDMELTLHSQNGKREMTLQEIYETVNPAVVGVTMHRDGREYGWGSGVIFTADGYIVINTHMIEGADAAQVILSTGERYDAKLVGEDAGSDIAILKIEGEGFPYAELGDSDELRVGDAVAAIGNPLGESYSGTMTNGIVSAINRTVTNQGHKMTLLQTNTAINEGSSGGALVNMYGQVIGITNMKLTTLYSVVQVEGMCFAIPTTVVKEVGDQILAVGMVSGEPTIGIVAAAVSDEAIIVYGLPAGVYVTEVSEGSDAKAQGLEAGDIILKVNGISVSSVAQVNAIKGDLSVGDTLTLTVYREGKTFDMDVRLVDNMDIQR